LSEISPVPCDVLNGVTSLKLDRSELLNIIDADSIEAVSEAPRRAVTDDSNRAITISSKGKGANIKQDTVSVRDLTTT
jgi:enoyl-CoA hydratase/carnithine racemase